MLGLKLCFLSEESVESKCCVLVGKRLHAPYAWGFHGGADVWALVQVLPQGQAEQLSLCRGTPHGMRGAVAGGGGCALSHFQVKF